VVVLDSILSEARAAVAAGRDPDWHGLRERIRSAGLEGRELSEALRRLERVGAVHRARRSAGKSVETAQAPPAPQPARPLLRTRPTVSGNMEVRRGRGHVLEWRPLPAVSEWEVRISERPDPRGDYVVREELTLPGTAARLELDLGETPLRVHLLGRARGGRLVQRAIVSALTRAGWETRWERRASAA